MGVASFIGKRIVNLLILLLLVALFNYYLFRVMPGDAISLIIDPKSTPAQRAALRAELGIGPGGNTFQAVLIYLEHVFTGNFGNSFATSRPVWVDILQRLPGTLFLLGGAYFLALILGVVTGISAASRRGRKSDVTIVTSSIFMGSLPVFWIGLLFVLLSVYLSQIHSPLALPFTGVIGPYWTYQTLSTNFAGFVVDAVRHAILPMTALTIILYGGYTLLMRNTFLDVLTEDYILTARAKGLPERDVLYRHALKNASLPLTTSVALQFGAILSGAALTETVFSWYGLGAYIVESVQGRDWPVLQGIFFLLAITTVVANFLADLVYGYLDPRVRL